MSKHSHVFPAEDISSETAELLELYLLKPRSSRAATTPELEVQAAA